jgi:diadenosine tetraphosphatase ApaH/serine/threonine PP2A family protein phosphatase
MKWNALILPGNHDLCLAGVESKYRLSEDSRRAMDLIQLPEDLKEEIRRWPRTQEKESITLVHGAASDPIWNYILDKPTAIREFKEIRTSHCFFGHSHNPGIFRLSAGEIEWIVPQMGKSYPLKNCRALVNPGSLGQPRDGDSRSSFMIFDTVKRCVTFYRNTYSVKRTQRKMIKRGFPPFLIDRLSKGI